MARPLFLLAPLGAALCLAAPWGCSTTDTGAATSSGTTGAGGGGQGSLSITSPQNGECIAVDDGPDAVIPVTLSLTNLYLRAPGYCSIVNAECGHVLVRVNGLLNNEGSTPTVDVLLRKLGDRYADLTIGVEVVKDDGTPLTSTDADGGTLLAQSVMVHARKSCTATSSSSASASASSSSSSGTGAGGASNTSSASSSSASAGGNGGAGGMGPSDAGDGG